MKQNITKDSLPPKSDLSSFSKPVLTYFEDKKERKTHWGIGVYCYDPPFNQSYWVDSENYSTSVPDCWFELPVFYPVGFEKELADEIIIEVEEENKSIFDGTIIPSVLEPEKRLNFLAKREAKKENFVNNIKETNNEFSKEFKELQEYVESPDQKIIGNFLVEQ